MPVIGVTGGIASGKTTVACGLAEALLVQGGTEVATFSADECAHDLIENDPVVSQEIQALFGKAILGSDGRIDRTQLRPIVFADSDRRHALEDILHPKIRHRWIAQAEKFRTPQKYFVAEIPLLYETEASPYFDCIVVVEADAQIQLERLSSKRGWSLETARRVIDAQMSAEEKRRRADILIVNHHTEELLHRQIILAARALLTRYA